MRLAVSNTFWAVIKRTFKNILLLTNAVYHRTSTHSQNRDQSAIINGAKKVVGAIFKIPQFNIWC